MAQEQKKPDPFTEDDLPEITPDAAAETEEEASALPDESEVTDPEVLRAEIAELKDRLLRALAETENLRKRAERDRRDAEQYGITRFARDLLSVHDNFERAMNAVTGEMREVAGPLIEGIELTQKELLTVFGRHGINKVAPAKGDRFDPKLHQAMFEAPVPGTSAGDIIEVMSEGFTIGERLLRPAQVGVSAGGPAGAPETPPAGSDGSAEGTS
ncbi:MAG TPA: nucleotide exchange factor GrpE [Paracoccaceae bacterium]|nr:nucleotide exchange factor GrpE [Paracoccaceae bacterium]